MRAKIGELARGLDLEDDVSLTPELTRVSDDARAGSTVVLVREAGADTGVGLDRHVKAEAAEALHGFRRRGDAPLSCHPLPRDADAPWCHAGSCFRCRRHQLLFPREGQP